MLGVAPFVYLAQNVSDLSIGERRRVRFVAFGFGDGAATVGDGRARQGENRARRQKATVSRAVKFGFQNINRPTAKALQSRIFRAQNCLPSA
jgi:hypothetical protein